MLLFCQVLYRCQAQHAWVTVNDILLFLPATTSPGDLRFIIASEETGFRHLYYVKTSLRSEKDLIDEDEPMDDRENHLFF